MKDEDRILLTFGWSTLLLGIILLICKVTYRMDQLDKRLDIMADKIVTAALLTPEVATVTDATTPTDATPTEPEEVIKSIGNAFDSTQNTLEASEMPLTEITEEMDTEELKAVPEASEAVTEVFTEPSEVVVGGLTAQSGVYQGPSGKETYYNLDMSGVVSIMRSQGYSEADYPYWIREDGVKMLGPYVMVAADFNTRPRGTVLETSLGTGLVCDTGAFANYNSSQLDIAVSW